MVHGVGRNIFMFTVVPSNDTNISSGQGTEELWGSFLERMALKKAGAGGGVQYASIILKVCHVQQQKICLSEDFVTAVL